MSDTPISPGAGSIAWAGVAASLVAGTVTLMTPSIGAATTAGVAPTLQTCVGPSVITEFPFESGVVAWPALANGIAGAPQPKWRYRNASFQAAGTWGAGGSIKLQGSNDGVTWNDLSPAALTGAGFFATLGDGERPKFFRPSVTAGDATTRITVTGWLS